MSAPASIPRFAAVHATPTLAVGVRLARPIVSGDEIAAVTRSPSASASAPSVMFAAHEQELVTTQPSHDVIASYHPAQPGTDLGEQ